MSKTLNFILVLITGVIFTQCDHDPFSPVSRELTELEKQLKMYYI